MMRLTREQQFQLLDARHHGSAQCFDGALVTRGLLHYKNGLVILTDAGRAMADKIATENTALAAEVKAFASGFLK